MSFTEVMRDELAHAVPGDAGARRAELAALLRCGGSLRLVGGGGLGWVGTVVDGAVARRIRAGLAGIGAAAEVAVEQAGGLRHRTTYRLAFADPDGHRLTELALLDTAGRPVPGVPHALVPRPVDAAAYVRGALMVAGSVSDPRREAHLELRAPGAASAASLVRLLARLGVAASVTSSGERRRVVVKSGDAIGRLLAHAGAHGAFLAWDQGRLRRELRGAANRVANADRANVSRSVRASARQVGAIERALASPAWAELDAELREIALARLANPEASLAELGALLDPPISKATVHRRLARLVALTVE